MNSNNNINNYIQEDEIDLKELFKTLLDNKKTIIFITIFITLCAGIFAFTKTPIYEVKSNIQIGFIGIDDNKKLLNDPIHLSHELEIIFNVQDKVNNNNDTSWVENISIDKKANNFLQVKTNGLSNEDALKKNEDVLRYIQAQNEITLNNFIRNTKVKIEDVKKDLKYVDLIEIPDIQREIHKLTTQKLAQIDEKLHILKTQDIKNIQREISLIQTQKIPAIDYKIKVLNNKLSVIQNKINFNKDKLKEYNNSVNKLYNDNKGSSSTDAMISSIQMVNYQNLILNTQNKIEDLTLEQSIIKTDSIPNLNNEKENLKNVTIDNLNKKIENIKNIDIVNLENQKININNDTLKKLQEKINITLKNKKIALENKIENLEYQISSANYSNSKLVGDYIVYDYPIKPKKKLIVVVAFVTGFILSIFFVFFREFVRNFNKEEEK